MEAFSISNAPSAVHIYCIHGDQIISKTLKQNYKVPLPQM